MQDALKYIIMTLKILSSKPNTPYEKKWCTLNIQLKPIKSLVQRTGFV